MPLSVRADYFRTEKVLNIRPKYQRPKTNELFFIYQLESRRRSIVVRTLVSAGKLSLS